MGTRARGSNNLNIYIDSTAPHLIPGGGGFSICNWSLYSLYKENQQLRNWWSKSNDNMPLVRYLGCKFTLYREAELDYLFYYNNNYPMDAKLITYQSTAPQVMMLNNKTKIMACKKHNKNKKPYRKIFVKPPSQLENRWYFQNKIAQFPLVQTIATACSLDRMYLNSSSISTSISITSLDTEGWKQHYWQSDGTQPYQPQPGQYIIALPNGPAQTEDISNIDITQCIVLGTIEEWTQGTVINSVPGNTAPQGFPQSLTAKKVYTAFTNKKYWGNPFFEHWFFQDQRIAFTNKTLKEICEAFDKQTKLNSIFAVKTKKWVELRYNPWADKGKGNMVWLLPIGDHLHSTDWLPQPGKEVIAQDLPLPILLWGYLDFHRKAKVYNDIDTKCICVIKSPYIQTHDITYIVPLDEDFLTGNSPYFTEGHKTTSDQQNWHPKVRFQIQTINEICMSQNGTIKLPKQISAECHMKYCFYFKFGGEPAPMSDVQNPEDQPQYPVPNNLLLQPSLQSPTTPFEYYLYNFDERRGQLTKRAAKRITENKKPETDFLSITETSTWCPTTFKENEETSETSSQEETETPSTEERLHQQRRQQKQLRKLIQQLLLQLTE